MVENVAKSADRILCGDRGNSLAGETGRQAVQEAEKFVSEIETYIRKLNG